MKTKINYFIFLTAGLLLNSFVSFAQENYTIKSVLKIDGLPPEYAAMAEQEIVTYIKGDHRKTEMTGMMGSTTIYFDGKKMTSLSDQMGRKTGFTASTEELDAEDKGKKTDKPKIEYTAEEKTIAGYKCTKAIATTVDEDKKENQTIVWFTADIKADRKYSNKGGRGMVDLSELNGFPLAIETKRENQGMAMTISSVATEIQTNPIDDDVFNVNTEGFTMMSYKEMKEMTKTMGGRQ